MRAEWMTFVLHSGKDSDKFGQCHTIPMVIFCMVCLVTYQFLMKYVSDLCVL